ncbi:hypothetical protein EDF42_1860 [Curtobacterium sp. PhB172]|uniref:GNAT family N-acetyltransferase n=1 Tax=Curtobacterium sp. PhB172 TaxID=2485196 RepID=UPI000F9D638D|nr:GNAT family N-acetyltransferase [Curtobacterium sp. PhB172]ROS65436.1 hypothetical protein EDF42_1860 [Curtobacterium sp. PhB172]
MDGQYNVVLEHVNAKPDDWNQLLLLAKANRATLGFLTDSAFEDRLERGTVVVARVGGDIVGYCIYDVPRAGYIKLVHVCVGLRGNGIGMLLVDAAVLAHPEAIGVVAYCRRDYGLDRFWAAVGLSPRGERAGRAAAGSTLTRWWMPLGELDLLEDAALGAGLPLVVYDTNIIADLYGSSELDRADRDASLGLTADWIAAEITVVVSPQVDVEIDRIDDEDERSRQRSGADHLVRLRSIRREDASVLDALLQRTGPDELAADPSLRDDLNHIADALAAHAAYFVTNDTRLLRLADSYLPVDTQLRVLRPHELIQQVDQRLGQPVFQSRLIEDIDLRWVPATRFTIDQLIDAFLTHERNERGSDLRRLIRASIAAHPRSTRVLIDERGRPWAMLAEHPGEGMLVIPLLRVARRRETTTVALQLARHTRHVARQNQLPVVQITDPVVADVVRDGLRTEGFDAELRAEVIDLAEPASRFLADHPSEVLRTAAQLRDVEHRYWPLVLLGAGAPTYIAPIQPRFIYPLFGIPRQALWGDDRPLALGLSREHVYYSGSSRALPPPGARILWYASADDTETIRSIVAYSRSLGCERTSPDEAFRRYKQLGVFKRRDVRSAGDKRGRVTVVRFEDTELFDRRIGGHELAELLEQHDVKHPIPSFRQVPSTLFDDLVQSQGRSVR